MVLTKESSKQWQGILPKINENNFEQYALEVFQYQMRANPVYAEFVDLLNHEKHKIKCLDQIPFLPIELFKSHKVLSGDQSYQKVFLSSGTTGQNPSKHYITDLTLYEQSFLTTFKHFFGNPADYCFLALLPSYLERENSSLVYMADHLIKKSKHPYSGFFLDDLTGLSEKLRILNKEQQPTILLGVAFALLDLAENFPLPLENITIMETGGMKGKRQEVTRQDLHEILKKAFKVDKIHSEYGMTELLSQAYSLGDGLFQTPPWMKVLIRDLYDPLQPLPAGQTGGINIIDLANIHSCAFIETQDMGKLYGDNRFEVVGRIDNSELRGCNLLLE